MPTAFKKMTASRQLAHELRLAIQQGKWLAGARLPTVRALAVDFGVSLNTVHAALKRLENDKLIECRPRQGAFVRTISEWKEHVSATAPRQVAILFPVTPGDDPTIDETHQTSRIINGIGRELSTHDLHPVLLSFEVKDSAASDKLFRQVEQLRPQLTGVIVFAVGALRQDLFDRLDELDLPWATINRLNHRVLENFVNSDGTQCGEAIGQCLAAANLHRVLVVGESEPMDTERIAGMLRGYWLHSQEPLTLEYLRVPNWREAPAFEITLHHLQKPDAMLPQAIVGLGDITAIGAMRAVQSLGIKVPEQVRVISTTGLAISQYTSPPLSAFQTPMEEIGQSAVKLLQEMLATGNRRIPGRFIAGEMILRQSFSLSP